MIWKSIKDFWSEDVPVKEEIKEEVKIEPEPKPDRTEMRECKYCKGQGYWISLNWIGRSKETEVLTDCTQCNGFGKTEIEIFDDRINSKEEKDDCI